MSRRRIGRAVMLAAIGSLAACGGTRSSARVEHNQGLAALAAKKFEEAEKQLLAARDHAGADDELRERAAYHLGLAHARHAESLGEEEAEHAIDLYRQGASWLRDAVRLDPDDREARQTLEVVLRRIQVLTDKLGREEGKLEARLDRLVEDQRGVLASVRALLGEIGKAGAASDPVGFRGEFDRIATAERQLGAEAGAIADLAADEEATIQAVAEDQRSPEQRGRLVGLEAMTDYTDAGRQAAAEVRLALRRLEGQVAHGRGDAALARWKRAREQLLDPVSVLQRVAGDQRETSMGTELLEKLQAGKISLKGSPAGPPPWLTAEILAQGEKDAGERATEVRARLEALSQAPAPGPGAQGGAQAAPDPEMARVQSSAREALPHLDRAIAAIKASVDALGGRSVGAARPHQAEAEDALFHAIELFAGLRQLIELAYGQEAQLVGLLDPKNEEATKLAGEERSRLVTDGAARNLERVKRLTGLLADEKTKAEAEAAQAAAQAGAAQPGQPGAQPGQPGAQPGQPPADEQAASRNELFARAEKARAGAEAALARLGQELRGGARGGARAKASAEDALHQLDELRRLFFTLIERLKELRERQGETHDKTATAQAAAEDARDRSVPPLADAEGEHAQVAQMLADALAKQADQAGQAGQADPKAAEAAENMRKATEEVRGAQEQMADAARVLGEARDAIGTQSTDLTPGVTAQVAALDHLDEAIRLLEPPKQDKDKDQKQDQKQDQGGDKDKDKDKSGQQGEKSPSPDEKVSAQQAERRLQSIRDREAERRREREERKQARPDPVDKDW
ncbi:MAG TPA: hypothetical protein VK698_37795 [Kofleriaceae bacterium]|nr:hypothetical protein [Kofleriaceae bacterium]